MNEFKIRKGDHYKIDFGENDPKSYAKLHIRGIIDGTHVVYRYYIRNVQEWEYCVSEKKYFEYLNSKGKIEKLSTNSRYRRVR